MRRNLELEATIVEKYAAVEAFLDERGRRIWAATESRAIGYGGDALVSDATGLSRPTIRAGRRELESGSVERGRIRRPGAGRPSIEQSQPGIKQALEKLVDPLTRGDPESPLRTNCSSPPVRAGATVTALALGSMDCRSSLTRRFFASTSATSRRARASGTKLSTECSATSRRIGEASRYVPSRLLST